jgi:hypothetical protein
VKTVGTSRFENRLMQSDLGLVFGAEALALDEADFHVLQEAIEQRW